MTVLLVADVHPLTGAQTAVRRLLEELTAATKLEDGCLGADAYTSFDGERLLVTSTWRDEAALRAHFRRPPYGRYAEAVTPFLAEPSQVVLHYVSESVYPLADPSTDPNRLG